MTTLTIGFLLVGALIVLVLLGMQIAYALFLVAFAGYGSSAITSTLPSGCWS